MNLSGDVIADALGPEVLSQIMDDLVEGLWAMLQERAKADAGTEEGGENH